MNELNFFLLEDEEILLEKDDLDLDVPEDLDVDDVGEDNTTENEENNEDDTKQNNNNEEEEVDETEGEETPEDTTLDTPEGGEGEDTEVEEETPEEDEEPEDTMTKNKRLSFYNNFESLYNVTLSFLDKLDSIKDSIMDEEKKNTLIELEKKLIKQKNDINFLLKKKIKTINEENLDKLLIVFTTKTDTIIDITKSVIKETK